MGKLILPTSIEKERVIKEEQELEKQKKALVKLANQIKKTPYDSKIVNPRFLSLKEFRIILVRQEVMSVNGSLVLYHKDILPYTLKLAQEHRGLVKRADKIWESIKQSNIPIEKVLIFYNKKSKIHFKSESRYIKFGEKEIPDNEHFNNDNKSTS